MTIRQAIDTIQLYGPWGFQTKKTLACRLLKGKKMKDIILGGLLGAVIAITVVLTYGFRIGVYSL